MNRHAVTRMLARLAFMTACLSPAAVPAQQPAPSDPVLQTPPLEVTVKPHPSGFVPIDGKRKPADDHWRPLREVHPLAAGDPDRRPAEDIPAEDVPAEDMPAVIVPAERMPALILPVQATEPQRGQSAAGQPAPPPTEESPDADDSGRSDASERDSERPDNQPPDSPDSPDSDYPQLASADHGLDRYALSRSGVSSRSLARVPNMFGDFFSPGGQVCYDLSRTVITGTQTVLVPTTVTVPSEFPSDGGGTTTAVVDVPTTVPVVQDVNVSGCIQLPGAGGFRRMKIAEQNSTLPQDRGLFVHSHFHNAMQGDVFDLPGAGGPLATGSQQRSLDRMLFGLEKTFNSGLGSVEVRVPLTGSDTGFRTDSMSVGSGALGNVAVIVKHLIYQDEWFASGVGLGFDLPTGGDASGRLAGTGFRLENDATRVLPFIGFAGAPNEDWFWLAFVQFDIPASGNPVLVDGGAGLRDVGRLNDPALLFLDVNTGCWLWRERNADVLAGLAAILELHYTTTLQDADLVTATLDGGASRLQFGGAGNRFDVVNLTAGLHAVSAAGPVFRLAGVFPLRSEANRFFDAEIQAAVAIPY